MPSEFESAQSGGGGGSGSPPMEPTLRSGSAKPSGSRVNPSAEFCGQAKSSKPLLMLAGEAPGFRYL
jgi:hypothetical protein